MCETVNNIIVHELRKEKNSIPSIHLNNVQVQVNDTVNRLVSEINKRYSGKVRVYGCFEQDKDNYPMGRFIDDFTNEDINFFDLSCKMMSHLKERAEGVNFATGGFVLIAHITHDSNDYIMVAIITEELGTAITEGLEIIDALYIELSNLKFAGRIDLTALSNGADRYISFLKGKGNVSEYFKKFLGCSTVIQAKTETEKVIKGLYMFAAEHDLSKEEKDSLYLRAHSHLNELEKNEEPFSIELISNLLSPENPESLIKILSSEELQLSDGFIPDKNIIKELTNFSGKTKNWKLDFSREAFRKKEVEYDQKKDVIILRNIPPKLKEALIEELS